MNTKPETSANYETTDAEPGTLVLWGVVVVGVLFFSVAASWVFFDVLTAYAERHDRKPSPLASHDGPPEPHLLTNEPANLADVLKSENEILETYGWVDKDKGIVRIPIDEAMAAFVKEAPKHTEAGSSS